VRFRRKRPASSVEPDRFDAAAEVLERWATRGSRQSALYSYKREARQRQQQRTRARTHTQAEAKESCSAETPVAAAPHPPTERLPTPPPIPEPVPSEPPQGPAAKTADEWAYEHFVAFEKLCGNGDRIAERLEEARAYEPEDPPPEYLW
jgi:hypothetical protein